MQCVSHAFFLCAQVTLIVFVRLYFDRHILHNFKSVCLQSHTFHGIVGEKPHFVHAKFPENLRAYAVISLIRVIAEILASTVSYPSS